MHNKRSFLHEFLLVFIGGIIGYFLALHGPKLNLGASKIPVISPWAQKFTHYQRSHPTEVLIYALMIGVILYLIFGRRGGGGQKR